MALGAVIKGRSASPSLNEELETGLPAILGFDVYSGSFWLPSPDNRSDETTRNREVRPPDVDLPIWWKPASVGDFALFDAAQAREEASSGGVPPGPALSTLLPIGRVDARTDRDRARAGA